MLNDRKLFSILEKTTLDGIEKILAGLTDHRGQVAVYSDGKGYKKVRHLNLTCRGVHFAVVRSQRLDGISKEEFLKKYAYHDLDYTSYFLPEARNLMIDNLSAKEHVASSILDVVELISQELISSYEGELHTRIFFDSTSVSFSFAVFNEWGSALEFTLTIDPAIDLGVKSARTRMPVGVYIDLAKDCVFIHNWSKEAREWYRSVYPE